MIDDFERAFRNQSSAALKRLQPSLTDSQLAVWDRLFVDHTSYFVEVIGPVTSPVRPDRVRVDGAIIRNIVPRDGGAPRRIETKPATIVLDRDRDGWVITDVRGPNWP